jgi:hypothetical protein
VNRFVPLAASLWLLADGIGSVLGAARPVHVAWMLATYGWLSWVLLSGQPTVLGADLALRPLPDLPRVRSDGGPS